MRSFRLDPDSVQSFVTSWRSLLACLVIGAPLGWFAHQFLIGRTLIPVLLGIALGPQLFDGELRHRYPDARSLWLLSIGMTTCLSGVVLRMSFPTWQGTAFDLTWLGISFVSILSFVLINRKDPNALK